MKLSIKNLKLSGVAACVPRNEVTMTDFYPVFGENEVKRISLSTGIGSVRIAPAHMRSSDLCFEASLELFRILNVDKDEIDAVVFISQTPDFIMPATSCILQNRLGLKKTVLAFDINYGCSGYIYGLLQAALLINTGACKKVLLCVGDTISKHLDPNDHKLRLVMGDGGSASLIEAGCDTWSFDICTDGSGYKSLIIPKNEQQNGFLYMDGAAIMEFALREVKCVIDSVVLEQQKDLNGISAIVLHQANFFMLQYLRKKIGVNKNIVPVEVDRYGNTGSASIPLTMCAHYADKKIDLNSTILAGFGVGLSWGAVLLNLERTVFANVKEL